MRVKCVCVCVRTYLCVCERVCARVCPLTAPFTAQPGMVPTLHMVKGGGGGKQTKKRQFLLFPKFTDIFT